MKQYFIIGGLALCTLAIGCGGGNGSGVSGNWQITLSENQAATIGGMKYPPPTPNASTQIDLTFKQDGNALSMPLAAASVPTWNIGCTNGLAGHGYLEYGGPYFGDALISFNEGGLDGQKVGFSLYEQVGNNQLGYSQNQELIFVGTVDSSSTMHGQFGDYCTNGNTGTWTATKIAALPTPTATH